MIVACVRSLARAARTVSYISAGLAALVLIAMTAFILIEIALRETIGVSSNVVVEFVGYGLAAMTMLGAAHTAQHGSLIRMSIVVHLVGPAIRRIMDAFCILCAFVAVAFYAYFVFSDMQRSYVRDYMTDSLVALPAWLPPAPMFLGLLAFLFQLLSMFLLVLSGAGEVTDAAEEV